MPGGRRGSRDHSLRCRCRCSGPGLEPGGPSDESFQSRECRMILGFPADGHRPALTSGSWPSACSILSSESLLGVPLEAVPDALGWPPAPLIHLFAPSSPCLWHVPFPESMRFVSLCNVCHLH